MLTLFENSGTNKTIKRCSRCADVNAGPGCFTIAFVFTKTKNEIGLNVLIVTQDYFGCSLFCLLWVGGVCPEREREKKREDEREEGERRGEMRGDTR